MKTVHINKNGHIDIFDLLKGTNVSPEKVYFYLLNQKKDGTLQVILFDENKKQIRVKEKK